MGDFLKLFRNHDEYEEYKREHPEPEPEPQVIPQVPMPNHVIIYEASSKRNLYNPTFNPELLIEVFEDGVGYMIFNGELLDIGNNAFYGSTGITKVELPESVETIGQSAFVFCTNLRSVVIDAVEPPQLGAYAFDNSNNCRIFVPSGSVESYKASWSVYADRIFAYDPLFQERWVEDGTMCSGYSLYTMEKLEITHDGGKTWEDGGETRQGALIERFSEECGYDPSAEVITYEATSKLAETTSNKTSGLHINAFNANIDSHTFSDGVGVVAFDETLITIGSNAFYGSASISSINIPNTVTNIGTYAFYNCSGLASLNIPDSVTSIGLDGFYNCNGLTSCIIGSGITSIGQEALAYCNNLTSLTIEATTPPTLGTNALTNTSTNLVIYVPSESVDTYKSASGWSNYASRIQAITD